MQAIEEALQAEGLVLTRETDLDAVNYYLQGQYPAALHVVVREADGSVQEADIDCSYACTPSGEFIVRWHGDTIEDVLTNGETFLLLGEAGEGRKVYFNRVRELFFGDTKAFIICTPVKANG